MRKVNRLASEGIEIFGLMFQKVLSLSLAKSKLKKVLTKKDIKMTIHIIFRTVDQTM